MKKKTSNNKNPMKNHVLLLSEVLCPKRWFEVSVLVNINGRDGGFLGVNYSSETIKISLDSKDLRMD